MPHKAEKWYEKKDAEVNEDEAASALIEVPPDPDPIANCIGKVGRWQVMVSIPMILGNSTGALHLLVMIFQNQDMDYDCINPDDLEKRCDETCEEFRFNTSTFDKTIVAQFNLTCHDNIYTAMSQSSIMCGCIVGTTVTFFFGLRGKEKFILILSSLLALVVGIALAFIPWLWVFLIMRFFLGSFIGPVMVLTREAITDLYSPSIWREIFLMIHQLIFIIGYLALPLFVYFQRHWMYVQIGISTMSVINFILFLFIPESARSALNSAQEQKAVKILRKAAKINKINATGMEQKVMLAIGQKIRTEHFFHMLRYPYIQVKIYAIYAILFSCGFTFFGMAEYIGTLPGNIFFNVSIAALVCIPGTFLAFVLGYYVGRRITLFFGLLLPAVILGLLVWSRHMENCELSFLICSLMSMFFTSISLPTAFIFAWELLPACTRDWSMRLSACFYFFGGQIATFIVFLNHSHNFIPPLVIACVSAYATIFCGLLPESKNIPLSETIPESETFGLK